MFELMKCFILLLHPTTVGCSCPYIGDSSSPLLSWSTHGQQSPRHACGRSRLWQDCVGQREAIWHEGRLPYHHNPLQPLHHFSHAPGSHGETSGEESRYVDQTIYVYNIHIIIICLYKLNYNVMYDVSGRNYGPPGTKKLVYFIDDMNMPEVDTYGTVQPHTLIRQHLDYQHWSVYAIASYM